MDDEPKKLVRVTIGPINLVGNYPIYRKVDGKLEQIPEQLPSHRYGLITDGEGRTYYLEYTPEEEAQADEQKRIWDAGAPEREEAERKAKEEHERFLASLKFDQKVVAFLDILGWKQAVLRAVTNADVQRLGTALLPLKSMSEFNRRLRNLEESEEWVDGSRVTHFSDCIVFSANADRSGWDALNQFLFGLSSNLIPHGLFLRGGVSVGGIYHKSDLVFGPALIDAYQLESTISKYPRVILAQGIDPYRFDARPLLDRPWRNDIDDLFFFNFLPPFMENAFYVGRGKLWSSRLQPVRDTIVNNLFQNKADYGVTAKYLWLARYFNRVCEDHPDVGIVPIDLGVLFEGGPPRSE